MTVMTDGEGCNYCTTCWGDGKPKGEDDRDVLNIVTALKVGLD